MHYYIIVLLILVLLYWYFILNEQRIIQVNIPIEKMSNISIFNGNNI